MILVDLATYLYRLALGKAKRKESQGKRSNVKECEGKGANKAVAKMREDIPKANKDNVKIWDRMALSAR